MLYSSPSDLLTSPFTESEMNYDEFRRTIINDYKIAFESRQASMLGRKDVLSGKAKFGIFGDGKELAQIAMAKAFRKGDWKAGYYRDQTFAFATGIATITQFFAQLYAHPDIKHDPFSGGRQMNSHFATRYLDENGKWISQMEQKNNSSDISTTGGQMARMVGLAFASKIYRNNPALHHMTNFSHKGNEVTFGTIGNASCAEGLFFEAFNAAGVLQIPMAISIWDDGYGISVPNSLQVTKDDISEILQGFQQDGQKNGYEIYKVKGWDYVALCDTYSSAIKLCREEHTPVMIHVTELTQPFGHSTSGSHERYKTKERLEWEAEFDCLVQMRKWILESDICTESELEDLEKTAKQYVKECQKEALDAYLNEVKSEQNQVSYFIEQIGFASEFNQDLQQLNNELKRTLDPTRKDIIGAARKALRITRNEHSSVRKQLSDWLNYQKTLNTERYNSKLYTDGIESPLNVPLQPARYDENAPNVDGREILNACFDENFGRDVRILAFGEDVGVIGDVNQGFAGLQNKHGEIRIFDTGIREMTIIGQAMGLSMRGLKPIAEIQYLDYVLYALNIISDDVASLSFRTKGGQKAPMIIRTRGHRLEGIWHSGSPMSLLLSSMRGLHICVPRNMTQAAGMYNTLLRGDEPAIMIESLNGYRLKERMPTNVGTFTVPLGVAEIIKEGTDVTVVSYGSTLRVVEKAAKELEQMDISVEIVDIQTLLPFDLERTILKSIQKTNKVIFIDEDVPGGASAYIMQQSLEGQGGYNFLDLPPRTLSAKPHRPPYGSDGDYFSKPSIDDIIEAINDMMHDFNPDLYPEI